MAGMAKKDKPTMSVTALIQGGRWPRIQQATAIPAAQPPLQIAQLQQQSSMPTSTDRSMDFQWLNSLDNSFMQPLSPPELKPDTALLDGLRDDTNTPPEQFKQYPPNHPLSGSKHLCSICGDRASGKHYGVYSCEGCKGFFKRTVRKDLKYACRESRDCIIDKRQRNRCQYCRYQKCLTCGMKREAVQEERQRAARGQEDLHPSSSVQVQELSMDRLLELESIVADPSLEFSFLRVTPTSQVSAEYNSTVSSMCQMGNKHLAHILTWAKSIPHFSQLEIEDQHCLIKSSWSELLIFDIALRSIDHLDVEPRAKGQPQYMCLMPGMMLHRESAMRAGVGSIFDRILSELSFKMRQMRMDRAEYAALKAIVLFNPDLKNLKNRHEVDILREKVYACLDEYVRRQHSSDEGRFAALLLRLPPLRSISLKAYEHLIFFRLVATENDFDNLLRQALRDMNSVDMMRGVTM